MRIVSIGGGPAGLFFAILIKKACPDSSVTVYERNRHDDTFGWGVVFSDETLDRIRAADESSFARIERRFLSWDRIDTFYRDTLVTSTGHGFCGLSRRQLLLILQDRAAKLGVELCFETEIQDHRTFEDADLILAADGVNSMVRRRLEAQFRPSLDWRRCKFAWFGTTKQLEAFTFVFKETEYGLFIVHAYPFEEGLSTAIVECREEVWRRAGLDRLDEAESVAFCEALFADFLGGARLLTNKSLWRSFPTVKNETWHHQNVVLIGDAAHTAHFSIGSGTKLAMEDAIALAEAFEELGTKDVPAVLTAYEASRRIDVIKTQKAAQTSLEWFENAARYLGQSPIRFTFNLMTRSKQITYDNLARRDPELVKKVNEAFHDEDAAAEIAANRPPAPIFATFRLRSLELENRIVVSPMCQYSAKDGTPNDWHLVHLGSRAIGGAGLVMTEMTDVCAEGRITRGCTGMYEDEHVTAWRRIVEFVKGNSQAAIGIQLAHAGRKGSCRHPWEGEDVPLDLAEGGWRTLAPSALPYASNWPSPKEMDRDDMNRIREAFVGAVERSEQAGFDLVELHMAHGYLLSSFVSPLANRRKDEYGGSLQNRMRYPLEVLDAARAAWPQQKPLSVRISATDWVPAGGLTGDDAVEIARMLRDHGCDVVDVSSGGNDPASVPEYGRMYHVPFAERIRYEVGMPVMVVGALLGADHCNTILAAGRADLTVMARPHLRDPYLTLHAAESYGHEKQLWPAPYLLARPRSPA